MKKLFILVFTFSWISVVYGQNIQPRPNPPQAVNDFAHLLEPFQVEALERKLRDYNDSTSSAIIVITVPDLQGYDIAQVALKYLRDWGVGVKGKNNGVVILVSKSERKARIETGYGMEGVLPDITAKHIIEDEMIPDFRNDDYYRGFDQAIDAIIKAAAGEYKAEPQKDERSVGGWFIAILIMIVIFAVIGGIGGGGGGRGGQYTSRRGSDILPWILLGDLMGRGGSRGGGFGGGGFGGGGFGGGGFGGFGGGSGGGGGASGGW